MRIVFLGLVFTLVLAAACTSDDDDDAASATPTASPSPSPTPVTVILQSLPETVAAGQEVFQCYYTSLPSAVDVRVARFDASLEAGIADMVLFRTADPNQPDGSQVSCGGGISAPLWVFAAHTSSASLVMPAGVGIPLRASQPVILQMHYWNPGATPLDARATVTLTLAMGTVQQAGTLVTYDGNISIPPNSTGTEITGECDTPDGVNFFAMTTYTHKLAVSARANRSPGGDLLVESFDWENPAMTTWTAPWLTFTTAEKLAYACTYDNPSGMTVTDGDASTDEVCMTSSYYFPATANHLCYSGIDTSFDL